MSYYVYVLLCEDGSYYTAYAKDMDLRLKQHMMGVGARYTQLHRPKRIVYAEEVDTISEAMKREREIKRLSHDEKKKLVTRAHIISDNRALKWFYTRLPSECHLIFPFSIHVCNTFKYEEARMCQKVYEWE